MNLGRTVSLIGILVSGVLRAGAMPGRSAAPVTPASTWQAKVDPWVLAKTTEGQTDFLVFLGDQADLTAAASLPTKAEKGSWVFRKLREVAQASQPPVLAALDGLGARHQSFWVANMIEVEGGLDTVAAMAQRGDVARVAANPRVHFSDPIVSESGRTASASPTAIEWNVQQIHAPQWDARTSDLDRQLQGGADAGQ